MKVPLQSSLFLVGPRQTGKSALLKSVLKNTKHFEVNLLKNEVYKRYKQMIFL
jgi:predicted AAA+ superfamily ATPase